MTGGSPSPPSQLGHPHGLCPPPKRGWVRPPGVGWRGVHPGGVDPSCITAETGRPSPSQGVGGRMPPGGPGVTPCGYLTSPPPRGWGVVYPEWWAPPGGPEVKDTPPFSRMGGYPPGLTPPLQLNGGGYPPGVTPPWGTPGSTPSILSALGSSTAHPILSALGWLAPEADMPEIWHKIGTNRHKTAQNRPKTRKIGQKPSPCRPRDSRRQMRGFF